MKDLRSRDNYGSGAPYSQGRHWTADGPRVSRVSPTLYDPVLPPLRCTDLGTLESRGSGIGVTNLGSQVPTQSGTCFTPCAGSQTRVTGTSCLRTPQDAPDEVGARDLVPTPGPFLHPPNRRRPSLQLVPQGTSTTWVHLCDPTLRYTFPTTQSPSLHISPPRSIFLVVLSDLHSPSGPLDACTRTSVLHSHPDPPSVPSHGNSDSL